MNRISTFSNRLKEYREQSGMTLESLSHRVGFPNQTLNRWERGDRIPKIDVVAVLAEKLNVSPLWLIGYDVAEFPSQPSENICSPSESALLNKFRALDARGQSAVLNVLEHEYQAISGDGSASTLSRQA